MLHKLCHFDRSTENKDTTVELQLGSKKTYNTLIFVRLIDNRTTKY